MGLDAGAKGLSWEDGFHCGYITYGNFLINLAHTYNEEFGQLYEKWYLSREPITQEEVDRMNEISDKGLDILLLHSDGDGKFTPKECRMIYNSIKDFHMDMMGHNYVTMNYYNMLDHWKNIFLHCARRRVNLWYS